MKIYIVIHPKQNGIYPYSLVDDEILKTIPKDQVYKKKLVENKLYSKEELEKFRDDLT